jgi:hypothetical protein
LGRLGKLHEPLLINRETPLIERWEGC